MAQTQSVLVESLGKGNFRETPFNAPAIVHLRVYANTTRPAASLFLAGFQIWNTDDAAPNYSDGDGNWRDAVGNIT